MGRAVLACVLSFDPKVRNLEKLYTREKYRYGTPFIEDLSHPHPHIFYIFSRHDTHCVIFAYHYCILLMHRLQQDMYR